MWREATADHGKPKKNGSYFEHRLEEFIKQKKKSKT